MPSASPLQTLIDQGAPRFRTATEYVESTLRQAILSGALPGGTPLRQEELAVSFRVSRMPIREALRQLEAQALVDFFPHRGAVVAEISPADAADNAAIRAALEPAALRLSLPRLEPADLERAAALIEEMDLEQDQGRMGELNRRFHMTLYAKAERPRLLTLTEQQLAASDRYLRFHLAALGRQHMEQEEHRAILQACAAGKAALACRLLAQHIEAGGRKLQAFLKERDLQDETKKQDTANEKGA